MIQYKQSGCKRLVALHVFFCSAYVVHREFGTQHIFQLQQASMAAASAYGLRDCRIKKLVTRLGSDDYFNVCEWGSYRTAHFRVKAEKDRGAFGEYFHVNHFRGLHILLLPVGDQRQVLEQNADKVETRGVDRGNETRVVRCSKFIQC